MPIFGWHTAIRTFLSRLRCPLCPLTDAGKVWGWGYGGEGQLGLGSRMRLVSTPQIIPHLERPSTGSGSSKSRNSSGVVNFSNSPSDLLGTRVIGLACGGRHSAVLTGTNLALYFRRPDSFCYSGPFFYIDRSFLLRIFSDMHTVHLSRERLISRHSLIALAFPDSGAVLSFGWGLYGQVRNILPFWYCNLSESFVIYS